MQCFIQSAIFTEFSSYESFLWEIQEVFSWEILQQLGEFQSQSFLLRMIRKEHEVRKYQDAVDKPDGKKKRHFCSET